MPTSFTTPARSEPSPEGKLELPSSSLPSRIAASPGLMPAALTSTSTSSLPSSRSSTSRTVSTSRPPYSSNWTARGTSAVLPVRRELESRAGEDGGFGAQLPVGGAGDRDRHRQPTVTAHGEQRAQVGDPAGG